MALSSTDSEYTVPGSQALQLVELVKRWHITAEELLGEMGLDASELEAPGARLRVTTINALMERARTLTGEPGLGFYLGLQKRASMYGYLGFAAMSAGTLGEAIELVVKFTPVITNALSLRLKVEGSVAALILEENTDLGSAREVVYQSLLVGLWQMSNALTGEKVDGSAEMTLPEPPYFTRFAHLLPEIRFDQPATRLLFDAGLLELPLIMPDRAAMRLARSQCERELQALGFDEAIVERVRRVLPRPDGFRSLSEVAAALHMSPRTLKRRLAARKISFTAVLDQERREAALLLLRSPQNTLEEITERLGYSTVPNLVRAFRRWTGETPAAYRRAIRTPGERTIS